MSDSVILVNSKDQEIGSMGKLEAHQKGLLHRAFSVLIFNSSDEFLIQRRAPSKYHSAGLWSNTCCSHPRPGESIQKASKRRLKEEMGVSCNNLKELYHFIYKVDLDNNLSEHELDHVLIGFSDAEPKINIHEASEWKFMPYADLKKDITENPDNYTFWFKIIFEKTFRLMRKQKKI